MKNHMDMKFMDYKQIYHDFELICPEKLIERCIVIAPRTKEISAIHSQNTNDQNKNKRHYKYGYDEDKELFETYLCNEELASPNRSDQFLFLGCPIGLSENLEQPALKKNYLQQKMDEVVCGTKPHNYYSSSNT